MLNPSAHMYENILVLREDYTLSLTVSPAHTTLEKRRKLWTFPVTILPDTDAMQAVVPAGTVAFKNYGRLSFWDGCEPLSGMWCLNGDEVRELASRFSPATEADAALVPTYADYLIRDVLNVMEADRHAQAELTDSCGSGGENEPYSLHPSQCWMLDSLARGARGEAEIRNLIDGVDPMAGAEEVRGTLYHAARIAVGLPDIR